MALGPTLRRRVNQAREGASNRLSQASESLRNRGSTTNRTGANGGRPQGATDNPQTSRQTGGTTERATLRGGAQTTSSRPGLDARIREVNARGQGPASPEGRTAASSAAERSPTERQTVDRSNVRPRSRTGSLLRGGGRFGLRTLTGSNPLGMGILAGTYSAPAGQGSELSDAQAAEVRSRLEEGEWSPDGGVMRDSEAGTIQPTQTGQQTQAGQQPQQTGQQAQTDQQAGGELTDQQLVEEALGQEVTPEEAAQILEGETLRMMGEDGQQQTSVVGPQGGTASIRAEPGAGDRIRSALAGDVPEGSGDASFVDMSGMREENQRLAQQRQQRQRRERRASLRRQATQTQGLDQSFSSMIQERARRRGAQQELASMDVQRQAEMEAEQAAADRASDEAIALLEEQGRNQRAGVEDQQAQEENFQERIDRWATGPEGEIDTNRRNFAEAFAQRAGVDQMGSESFRQMTDFYETAQELDTAAEEASLRPWQDQLVNALRTGILGLGTVAAARFAPGRVLTGLTAGGGTAGTLASAQGMGEGEQTAQPTAETPEELFGFFDQLREAGVGERDRGPRGGLRSPFAETEQTVEWRGQTVNLSELPPAIQQRLGRLAQLAPRPQPEPQE